MYFPDMKLSITEAEKNNLEMALACLRFTEGVHSGRTFAEVYENYESPGYVQSCKTSPKIALVYRLYSAYSIIRSSSKKVETEKDECAVLNRGLYGNRHAAARIQQEMNRRGT